MEGGIWGSFMEVEGRDLFLVKRNIRRTKESEGTMKTRTGNSAYILPDPKCLAWIYDRDMTETSRQERPIT